MKPAGIHHAAILVTDVARATRFYTEVLGFALLERPDLGFEGAWLASGRDQLHLVKSDAPEQPSRRHLAYAVDDPGAVRTTLEQMGIPFEERREVGPGGAAVRRVFLRDPDQNLIELVIGSEDRSAAGSSGSAPAASGPPRRDRAEGGRAR